MTESTNTAEEKEYEALATVRDILVLLYNEIGENIGREPEYLLKAFEYVSQLTEMMSKEVFQ